MSYIPEDGKLDNEMGNPGIVPLHVPGSESMQKIRGVAKLAQWLAHLL